jgi:lipoprotein-anchoring transpeptidase ErfK/SrfK
MVTANQTTVYSRPDTSSQPNGSLAGGAIVVVTRDRMGSDGTWTQILDGYVRSSDITEFRAEWVAEATAPSVALYTKPNSGSGIRRTARQGALLRVTGVSAGVDGNRNIWWATTEGFAPMGTLKLSTSDAARAWTLPDVSMAANGWWGRVRSSANLRATASTAAPIVGTFRGGERVKVLAEERGEMVSGSDRWYRIDGGRYAGARIHSSLVARIAQPQPVTVAPERVKGAASYIAVDRSAFTLTYVRDGKPSFSTYVSLGRAGVDTPIGVYSTFGKFRADRMTSRSVPDATGSYDFPNVPYTQYYKDGGYAIHGTYWHDVFGTQESQGCINLTLTDAAYLFNLTDPQVPGGENERWRGEGGEATPVVIAR